MHEISEESIHIAQLHANQVQEHGKRLVELGIVLQSKSDKNARDCGYSIEEYGKLIQQYGYESLLYAQAAQNEHSVEFYSKAVEAHAIATQIHVQATKVYTERVKALE